MSDSFPSAKYHLESEKIRQVFKQTMTSVKSTVELFEKVWLESEMLTLKELTFGGMSAFFKYPELEV
jgi:hypothetical protein